MRNLAATLAAVALFVTPACSGDDEPEGGASAGLVAQGQEAFHLGQYDLAIERYNQALGKQPGQASVHNLLGMAYRFKQDRPDEIASFQKAIELDANFWAARVNLGVTFQQDGRTEEAATQFRRVLELRPDHPQAGKLRKMIGASEAPKED